VFGIGSIVCPESIVFVMVPVAFSVELVTFEMASVGFPWIVLCL